jgi:PAS domain S-box-containing protein
MTAIDHDLESPFAGRENTLPQPNAATSSQDALLAFGRRASAHPPLSVLIRDAAELVAEVLGADLAGVGEVTTGGTMLELKLFVMDKQGKPSSLAVHDSPLDTTDSMAAFALRTASPVATADLARETRFTDGFLRKQQVRSAVVVPLHLNGKPFGLLGVYSTTVRNLDDDDMGFAETIAHLLTASIARIKAEEELHGERAVKSAITETVGAMILMLDAEGRLVEMNRTSQELTKFSVGEVRDRPFWNVFAVPEETDLVRGIFRSSLNSKVPNEFEGFLLTKDGSRKRVSWSLKSTSDGGAQLIILTGVDQTELMETKDQLQKVKSVAERAARELIDLRRKVSEGGPPTGRSARGEVSGASSPANAPVGPFHPLEDALAERRASPRRAYPFVQRIAPWSGDAPPSPNQFFRVQCKDIAEGGIAFFMGRLPDFENLVIGLGHPPKLTYITARVVRVAGVEHNGKHQYLVGCRFTGRLRQ